MRRRLKLVAACVVFGVWLLVLPGFTQEKPSEVLYEEDITYGKGGDTELKLDFARPREGGPFPAIVCIHGGAWRGGSRTAFRQLIKDFARKGYAAVTVSYRFCPKDPFPAQVEDVKCAVRWLRANAEKLRVDPNHIGATGASAGGHLSLMLGVMGSEDGLEGNGGHADQSSQVQCVVNFFGPTDLAREFPENVRGLLIDFLGGTPAEKPDIAAKASPVTYLGKGDPPILTFHGTKDNIVPYEQATILDAACKKAGVPHELATIQDAGHGWGGEQMRNSIERTVAFFDKHLKGK